VRHHGSLKPKNCWFDLQKCLLSTGMICSTYSLSPARVLSRRRGVALKIDSTTVARRVRTIESALGARLFERTADGPDAAEPKPARLS